MTVGWLQFNNTIMALKKEQWNYIIALIAVCALAIFLISQIFLKGYEETGLAIQSSEEIQNILLLQSELGLNKTLAANADVNKWHLFGTDTSTIPAGSNFALLGIEFSENDASQARAIISVNSKDADIYRVGDQIAKGVSIESISADQVILIHNGIQEKLHLAWEQEEGSQANLPVSNPQYPPGGIRPFSQYLKYRSNSPSNISLPAGFPFRSIIH